LYAFLGHYKWFSFVTCNKLSPGTTRVENKQDNQGKRTNVYQINEPRRKSNGSEKGVGPSMPGDEAQPKGNGQIRMKRNGK
jgi:hypothetical protein